MWASGLLASWGTYSLLTLTGMVSGLLVGAGYYRFGGLRGTLLLPLGLVPVLSGQFLIDHHSPDSLGHRLGLEAVWYAPVVVVLAVLGAVGVAVILRRSRIGTLDV